MRNKLLEFNRYQILSNCSHGLYVQFKQAKKWVAGFFLNHIWVHTLSCI